MRIRLFAILALAAAALAAPAATFPSASSEAHVPLDEFVTNECTGDLVHVTGFKHVLVTSTDNRTVMQTNWQVTEAIDLTPPVFSRYEANQVDRFYILGGKPPFTIGDQIILELVSLDKTPNMILRVTFEVIFDPSSGDPPVFNDEMRIECSGRAEP